MRLVTIIFALILSVWMVTAEMDMTFDDFVVKNKKHYSSLAEKQKREQIYAKNVAKIDQLNKESQKHGWTTKFGVTSLTDLEDSEIVNGYMGLKMESSHHQGESRVEATLATTTTQKPTTTTTKTTTTQKPTMTKTKSTTTTQKPTTTTTTTTTTKQNPGSLFDWTTANPPVVTPVKNQAGCGSCWAFASVATLEGYYANKLNKPLTSLSEQQLVDCDTTYAAGCNGGNPYFALQYELQMGAETESTYPYTSGATGASGTCAYNSALEIVKPMNIGSLSSESQFMSQYGPFVVTLHIDDMYYYTGGIFMASSCTSTDLDHAVTLVGYGTENGVDYWKIKNSWGTSWGENGYFRIQRNQGACGLARGFYISQ